MKTKKIIYVLFIIATILCAVGCGTRKTQIDKLDVKTKDVITDNSTITTNTDTNVKVIDCTSTDEIEIIPVDNTKEIVVNGKSYKNVRLKHMKVTTNVITTEHKKSTKKRQNNVKIKSKSNTSYKQKEVVSDKGNFWQIIGFILFAIGVIWFVLWSRKIVKDKEKLL